MKKPWVLSYPLNAQRRCPGWSETSLGARSLCWFCHVVAHINVAHLLKGKASPLAVTVPDETSKQPSPSLSTGVSYNLFRSGFQFTKLVMLSTWVSKLQYRSILQATALHLLFDNALITVPLNLRASSSLRSNCAACFIWAPPSEFVSSSIPSWQTLTAHAQPFRGARDLAFCLKVPLDSLLVWASSEGSGETARMRRLAWTFAARIGDKYQIRLARPIWYCLTVPKQYLRIVEDRNVLEVTALNLFLDTA